MLDLLSRLTGVRHSSDKHGMACCPAHEDKAASLSWRDVGDRWLLHCFRGCEVLVICNAIGIEFRDLFHDQKIRASHLYRGQQRCSPRDALAALAEESLVVLALAEQMQAGPLEQPEMDRLYEAVLRITKARDI